MAIKHTKTLIIGAGVAGLGAGYFFKKKNYSDFLILEKNAIPGKKFAISGGGMGNLTNKNIGIDKYVGNDTAFIKPILSAFSYKKAMNFFQELHIPTEEREFGQIFSKIPANDIVESISYGLPILYHTDVQNIEYENSLFTLHTSRGTFTSNKLILATGSNAWPQIGSTDKGIEFAQDLGIKTLPFTPALVPYFIHGFSYLKGLQGITVQVGISIYNKQQIFPLLFTHTGISGPACLILSCFPENKEKIQLDFLPQTHIKELCHAPENGKLLVKNLLSKFLPDRLALALVPETIKNKKVAELSKLERNQLAENIHCHILNIKPASFEKAEAARNGVLTSELNQKNLATYSNPHLYFLGELMDITGLLGGYNIHFALASSYYLVKNWDLPS